MEATLPSTVGGGCDVLTARRARMRRGGVEPGGTPIGARFPTEACNCLCQSDGGEPRR
jgi:hypothetical protein